MAGRRTGRAEVLQECDTVMLYYRASTKITKNLEAGDQKGGRDLNLSMTPVQRVPYAGHRPVAAVSAHHGDTPRNPATKTGGFLFAAPL